MKDLDREERYKRLSDEDKREMREAMNSYSYDFSRSGDTITVTVKFTPSKKMRDKSMFGFGGGALKIRSLARAPYQLFGFVKLAP